MPIRITQKGSFNNTRKYLIKTTEVIKLEDIQNIADNAIIKLRIASPYETIASNWSYEIIKTKNKVTLFFLNSEIQEGSNAAIIMDVGYASKSGKWISGRNYIKKPMNDIYNTIIKETKEALKNI